MKNHDASMRRGGREHAGGAEPRFEVLAKAMHLRTGIDPSRMHDVDTALEIEAFRMLTTRLVREQTGDHS